MTSPIVIISKWVSPRANFNLIFPSSTSVRIKNVCTQTVKLWNTAKLEDKDKPSWYWNQFWFLAREIPNLWFQYSCLIFFRSGTFSRTWIYCSTQNLYPSWFMFPKYSSVPQPNSKRKRILQILRTCAWSFERQNIRRSSSLVKMYDLEFHFSELGTLKLKNSCGFHFTASMSGGNKSSDVLKEH